MIHSFSLYNRVTNVHDEEERSVFLLKKQKMKNPQKKAMHIVTDGYGNSKTDPFGSYTGVCRRRKEIPTQDADDL